LIFASFEITYNSVEKKSSTLASTKLLGNFQIKSKSNTDMAFLHLGSYAPDFLNAF
jgi:hypothetical protein